MNVGYRHSTAHWQPILNGYSGFQPASFHQVAEALRGFPDSTALEALRSRGVTYAFVHVDRLAPDQVAALHRSASLTRLRTEGSIELYRLEG